MKKSRLVLTVLLSSFILLGGAIWMVKTQPNIKNKLREILGLNKTQDEGIKTENELSQKTQKKPSRLLALPEFKLIDQNNEPFSSQEMVGKIWVVNFISTRDQKTAEMQTANVSALQSRLSNFELWNDVLFITISVDPEYDQPNILRAYSESLNVSLKNRKFLTGDRNTIWELCRDLFTLDFGKTPPAPGNLLFQTNDIILLDRGANFTGHYNGVQEKDIVKLLGDILTEIPKKEGKIAVPESIVTPLWLDDRKAEQLKTISEFEVYHDFMFTDKLNETGINFRNQITGAGGRYYEAVHYDHGNGLAVADVDNDGWEDIYFVTQLGTNQLWRNLGNGKFEDITAKAGLEMKEQISVGASFADIDNDGDADLFVTTVKDGNRLFENTGNGTFKDVSKPAGLDYIGHSSGSVFFDYDKDGLLDLFVTNVGQYTTDSLITMKVTHPDNPLQNGTYTYYAPLKDAFAGHLKPERTETSILYKNKGNNQFEDVTEAVKLNSKAWSGDATPLDADADGWVDLYVLNMQGDDEYYENVEGKYFKNKSRELFPKTSWGAMGVKSFDYNNDENLDIYVTDMHIDMGSSRNKTPIVAAEKMKTSNTNADFLQSENVLFGNAMFQGKSDGTFNEVSEEINGENFWPWGLSVGDINADGYEDIFVASSMNFSFRYAINSVLLNNKGKKFMDSEFILGVEPRKNGISAAYWFNIDCDGSDKLRFECQERSGKYEVFGAMGSRSSAIFDIDHDGDLDIITSENNGAPMVLINNLSDKKEALNYLKIKLIGSSSNKEGFGAKVTVKTKLTTQTKVKDGKSGYLSQSSIPLYFGLGETKKIQQIDILWPSGKKQTIRDNIPTNDLLIIEEK